MKKTNNAPTSFVTVAARKRIAKAENAFNADKSIDIFKKNAYNDYKMVKNKKINKKTNETQETTMKKYLCDVCGWEYDEEVGDPENGIAPGTKFEDLPEDFACPLCGVGKDQFSEA